MTHKTVADAVDYFKGVWPTEDGDRDTIAFGLFSHDFWAQAIDELYPDDEQLVCTRAEFEAEVERRKAATSKWLPLEGDVCEYYSESGDKWHECEVRYMGSRWAVFKPNGRPETTRKIFKVKFRPLKTKEEREIEEMKSIVDKESRNTGYVIDESHYHVCEWLQKHGYHKQEKPNATDD